MLILSILVFIYPNANGITSFHLDLLMSINMKPNVGYWYAMFTHCIIIIAASSHIPIDCHYALFQTLCAIIQGFRRTATTLQHSNTGVPIWTETSSDVFWYRNTGKSRYTVMYVDIEIQENLDKRWCTPNIAAYKWRRSYCQHHI